MNLIGSNLLEPLCFCLTPRRDRAELVYKTDLPTFVRAACTTGGGCNFGTSTHLQWGDKKCFTCVSGGQIFSFLAQKSIPNMNKMEACRGFNLEFLSSKCSLNESQWTPPCKTLHRHPLNSFPEKAHSEQIHALTANFSPNLCNRPQRAPVWYIWMHTDLTSVSKSSFDLMRLVPL